MATKLFVVCSVLAVAQHAAGQGMFDFFGGGMGTTAGLFDFGFGGGHGGGHAGGVTQANDPAAREARITAAEEQMAEAMSETGRNSPERRRIETLIHLSGGKFGGDASSLNYLVDEYMMTTPGPETTAAPETQQTVKKAGAGRRGGKNAGRGAGAGGRRGGGSGRGGGGGGRGGGGGGGKGGKGRRGRQQKKNQGNRTNRGQQNNQAPAEQWTQRAPNQPGGAGQQRGNQWNQRAQDQWAHQSAGQSAHQGNQQAWDQWAPATQDPWMQQGTGTKAAGNSQSQRSQGDPWLQQNAGHSQSQQPQANHADPWSQQAQHPQSGVGQQGQTWANQNAWNQQQAPQVQQNVAPVTDRWSRQQSQSAVQQTQASAAHYQAGQNEKWNNVVHPTQAARTQMPQMQQPPPTFKKRTSSSRSPAAERLRRIQTRIDAVQEQLTQAQSLSPGSSKMHELMGQLEALMSVRSILTGNSGQPASMQTMHQSQPAAAQLNGFSSTWAPVAGHQSSHASQNYPNPNDMHYSSLANSLHSSSPVYQTRTTHPETTTWGVAPPSSHISRQLKRSPVPQGGGRFIGLQSEPSINNVQRQILLNRKRKSSRWAKNQARASSLSMSGFNVGSGINQFKKNMDILSPKEMDALVKANGEPTPASNGTKPAPPIEGEVKALGKKQYVFRDVDGFDTFQWVLSTKASATQTKGQAVSSPSPVLELVQVQNKDALSKRTRSPRRRRHFAARNRGPIV